MQHFCVKRKFKLKLGTDPVNFALVFYMIRVFFVVVAERMLLARSACPRKSKHDQVLRFPNLFLPLALPE